MVALFRQLRPDLKTLSTLEQMVIVQTEDSKENYQLQPSQTKQFHFVEEKECLENNSEHLELKQCMVEMEKALEAVKEEIEELKSMGPRYPSLAFDAEKSSKHEEQGPTNPLTERIIQKEEE